jgi:hypothetical protein
MGKEVVNYGLVVNDGTGDAMHIAFAKVDAGARMFTIEDKDLTAPPGAPAIGDCYIVGGSATGDWATHDGKIAVYGLGATWRFVTAAEGMMAYARDEDLLYRHDGSAWTELVTRSIELSFFAGGVLAVGSEILFSYIVARAFELPAGLTGSYVVSGVAATASAALSIRKNGVEVGTAAFAAAGTTATLAMPSATSFAPGDILSTVSPASPDATLADVSATFLGERA